MSEPTDVTGGGRASDVAPEAAVTLELTMSDLRELSAGAIRGLPHAVPIKNGDETLGFLVPAAAASPELLASASVRTDLAGAKRTPGEDAEFADFDALLTQFERD